MSTTDKHYRRKKFYNIGAGTVFGVPFKMSKIFRLQFQSTSADYSNGSVSFDRKTFGRTTVNLKKGVVALIAVSTNHLSTKSSVLAKCSTIAMSIT